MSKHSLLVSTTAFLLVVLAACNAPATPTPTAPAPTVAAPTAAPPTEVPPTAAPATATLAPTATSAPTATIVAGQATTDVVSLVNDKFNTVDTKLALWAIQPGLGTVMLEYGNRLARLWFAANAGNWDMAKYQLDEMVEIQEVGETTRAGRAPMLKAFEDNYLKKIDPAIAAKDKAAFTQAFGNAVAGCNACHTASTGDELEVLQVRRGPDTHH